jgi:hypothetical protein
MNTSSLQLEALELSSKVVEGPSKVVEEEVSHFDFF